MDLGQPPSTGTDPEYSAGVCKHTRKCRSLQVPGTWELPFRNLQAKRPAGQVGCLAPLGLQARRAGTTFAGAVEAPVA